jgi:hypothetical protein
MAEILASIFMQGLYNSEKLFIAILSSPISWQDQDNYEIDKCIAKESRLLE